MSAFAFAFLLCGFYEGGIATFGIAAAWRPDAALALALWAGLVRRDGRRLALAFGAGAAAGAFSAAPWGLPILVCVFAAELAHLLRGARSRQDGGVRLVIALLLPAALAATVAACVAVLERGEPVHVLARGATTLALAVLLRALFRGPRQEGYV